MWVPETEDVLAFQEIVLSKMSQWIAACIMNEWMNAIFFPPKSLIKSFSLPHFTLSLIVKLDEIRKGTLFINIRVIQAKEYYLILF